MRLWAIAHNFSVPSISVNSLIRQDLTFLHSYKFYKSSLYTQNKVSWKIYKLKNLFIEKVELFGKSSQVRYLLQHLLKLISLASKISMFQVLINRSPIMVTL